jgi:predicted naringenin-chalcone synthase
MTAPVCLISVGISYPPNSFDSKAFGEALTAGADYAISKLDPNKPEEKQRITEIRDNVNWVISLAEASGIEKRHTHMKDIIGFFRERNFCPTVQERAEIWRKECPALSMKAVDKCIANWGGDKDRIRTVVAHSTTGWDVP